MLIESAFFSQEKFFDEYSTNENHLNPEVQTETADSTNSEDAFTNINNLTCYSNSKISSNNPHNTPLTIHENLEKSRWLLLKQVGLHYGIDLTKNEFELALSKRMSENDINFVKLEIVNHDEALPVSYMDEVYDVYEEIKHVIDNRYFSYTCQELSNAWFYLIGQACKAASSDEINEWVKELRDLELKAVEGVPLYSKEVASKLIIDATSKMNSKTAALARNIGRIVAIKAKECEYLYLLS
jgi:hypothetical protein